MQNMCRDMPIRTSLHEGLAAIRQAASQQAMQQALQAHFLPAGSDLEPAIPTDWQQEGAAVFDCVRDEATRDLAVKVYNIWPLLFRKVWMRRQARAHSGAQLSRMLTLKYVVSMLEYSVKEHGCSTQSADSLFLVEPSC